MSIVPKKWHNSWNGFMTDEKIIELNKIENMIGNNYLPNENNVMRFLNTDLSNIKCVIIGMDPYPSNYLSDNVRLPVATGRAFEVDNISSWCEKFKQASLRNILKTIYYNETEEIITLEKLRDLIDNNLFSIAQPHDWFNNLEEQGVLFLNAALTVEKGAPNSHMKYWECFSKSLISYINSNTNSKWLLWGNNAQEFALSVISGDNIYTSKHPRMADFVKENPFQYVPEINWTGLV